MMNEVNPLIWPAPGGIGFTDKAAWDQTIQIALDGKVLKAAPAEGAYRNDLVEKAWVGLEGDKNGTNFTKGTVTVTEGGN
jgi:NitT/TauT family transport system substrate-binding protein